MLTVHLSVRRSGVAKVPFTTPSCGGNVELVVCGRHQTADCVLQNITVDSSFTSVHKCGIIVF